MKPIFLGLGVLIFFSMGFCIQPLSAQSFSKIPAKMPVIATTIPSLGALLRSVVGQDACQVQVRVINTVSVDHHFEMKPSMVTLVKSAAWVVLAGGGMDSQLESLNAKNTVTFEQLGFLRDFNHKNLDEHTQDHKDASQGHHHPKGMMDPHFWLDPVYLATRLEKLAQTIYRRFSKVCVLTKLQENVSQLHQKSIEFKQRSLKLFSRKGSRHVIATHDAFRYFIELLKSQGVVIQYEVINPHYLGSKKLVQVIQSLKKDKGVVWDLPPFSFCKQLSGKLKNLKRRCLELDPSGFGLSQKKPKFNYTTFYEAFLKSFQVKLK